MSKRTSSLLIDEAPLQVMPTLACKVGLNRATFLQQLHYWLQKPGAHVKDGRRWIYNTYEDWHEQFPFWSVEAIRKIVSQLRSKGVIETTDKYNTRRSDKTLWYTIDYDVFSALFDPEEEPDKSTQTLNPPDKSTEPPDKSTDVEPDKSTERYQESTETTNRDSDLQPGEVGKNTASPPEDLEPKEPKPAAKPADPKQYAVAQLMDRVKAAKERGTGIHSPTNDERKQFGSMFSQAWKDGGEVDVLLLALDYQVSKASGEIEGEPKAWCGYRTALDRVSEGWRPAALQSAETPESEARKAEREREWAEIDRLTAEIMADVL